MKDVAELLLPVGVPLIDKAKTLFDVVARTRNPAAMSIVTIETTFVVLMSFILNSVLEDRYLYIF